MRKVFVFLLLKVEKKLLIVYMIIDPDIFMLKNNHFYSKIKVSLSFYRFPDIAWVKIEKMSFLFLIELRK